jgi:hypothetical protein
MTIETYMKDDESGYDYPVTITYTIEHNDGNYPDEFDVSIEKVTVPVVCEKPTFDGKGYWENVKVDIVIWDCLEPLGRIARDREKKAIQAVRDHIEICKIEAEEGRQSE